MGVLSHSAAHDASCAKTSRIGYEKHTYTPTLTFSVFSPMQAVNPTSAHHEDAVHPILTDVSPPARCSLLSPYVSTPSHPLPVLLSHRPPSPEFLILLLFLVSCTLLHHLFPLSRFGKVGSGFCQMEEVSIMVMNALQMFRMADLLWMPEDSMLRNGLHPIEASNQTSNHMSLPPKEVTSTQKEEWKGAVMDNGWRAGVCAVRWERSLEGLKASNDELAKGSALLSTNQQQVDWQEAVTTQKSLKDSPTLLGRDGETTTASALTQRHLYNQFRKGHSMEVGAEDEFVKVEELVFASRQKRRLAHHLDDVWDDAVRGRIAAKTRRISRDNNWSNMVPSPYLFALGCTTDELGYGFVTSWKVVDVKAPLEALSHQVSGETIVVQPAFSLTTLACRVTKFGTTSHPTTNLDISLRDFLTHASIPPLLDPSSSFVNKCQWIENELLILTAHLVVLPFLPSCWCLCKSHRCTTNSHVQLADGMCESWIHCFVAPPCGWVAVCVSRHRFNPDLECLWRFDQTVRRVVKVQPVVALVKLSRHGPD
ncbi:hypothetical protein EGR_09064 [Echinococcus granulosus]|uniref:Uncharacterized protein n=1 Tax=Echinococcus granulosus TaxID=6210 RepID=W6URQ9_ECHGR|nr:hypothetical protein EGR_09064 [Echinococcus granulosus]EUB56074.1 hypothetical protein EGR_09064 [Echinococcus granulosus]